MKRTNDEIFFEETNRKEIKLTTSATTCQVIITLDETIGSTLLHHKFKYQTTELQLFLQNVPVLYWYPHKIRFANIDACIFSAALRNNFHDYSTSDMVENMLRVFSSSEQLKELLIGLLSDELFILQALEEFKKGGNNKNPLEYISDQLKDDEKFMLKAIKVIGYDALRYTSLRLRYNEQYITIASQIPQSSPKKQIYSKDVEDVEDIIEINADDDKEALLEVLEAIKSNCVKLKYASDRLKDNEQIVLQILEHNEKALYFASDRLKDDEEFMLKVVKQNVNAFEYASDRLKDDEEFVLEAVKHNGYALNYASKRFKDNEEIVLEAFKENRYVLNHASDRLKDDEEFILQAVNLNVKALKYTSNRLLDNEFIILQAVKLDGNALKHVSNRLKDNEEIVLQAVKHNRRALKYASDRLTDNEVIVLEAVKQNGNALKRASDRLKDNEEIVLQAVKHDGYALNYASNRCKDNEIIVLEAFKENYNSLAFASNRLRNDLNFSKQIFKNCNDLKVFKRFGEKLRNIEFINYYIENYQSHFHEFIRNNIKMTISTAIFALEKLRMKM